MRKAVFGGYAFKEKLCATVTARVKLKQFGSGTIFAHEPLNESNDISMTHTEVIRWLNECDSFEYQEKVDGWHRTLIIHTDNYDIYVEVPK